MYESSFHRLKIQLDLHCYAMPGSCPPKYIAGITATVVHIFSAMASLICTFNVPSINSLFKYGTAIDWLIFIMQK